MDISILDFGAVGDGFTLNTAAIQSAIDACASVGGGKVTIPSGVYKSGTIWLRNNVEMHLAAGAEIFASDNMDDYNELDAFPQNASSIHEGWLGKHLIIAHEIENVKITGCGTINGNCQAFVIREDTPVGKVFGWCNGRSALKDPEKMRPGQMVCFIECKNVLVEGVTMTNSPSWTCLIHGSENVTVDGIKIFNPIWMQNSDGIDIDASRYVTVKNCTVDTGDDAITLRACEQSLKNKDVHCEYVTVENCTLATGICAFRLGVGTGPIRHARISNIKITRAMDFARFCTAYNGRGCANIEDIRFSNVTATGTDRFLEVIADNGAFVKDIVMENIKTSSTIKNEIDCINGKIDNITVKNVDITFSDKAKIMSEESIARRGDCLLTLKNATRVTFDNVKIYGSLTDVDKTFDVSECEGLTKNNCNF